MNEINLKFEQLLSIIEHLSPLQKLRIERAISNSRKIIIIDESKYYDDDVWLGVEWNKYFDDLEYFFDYELILEKRCDEEGHNPYTEEEKYEMYVESLDTLDPTLDVFPDTYDDDDTDWDLTDEERIAYRTYPGNYFDAETGEIYAEVYYEGDSDTW